MDSIPAASTTFLMGGFRQLDGLRTRRTWRGEIEWAAVDACQKELHRDFEHALAETKLPERPD